MPSAFGRSMARQKPTVRKVLLRPLLADALTLHVVLVTVLVDDYDIARVPTVDGYQRVGNGTLVAVVVRILPLVPGRALGLGDILALAWHPRLSAIDRLGLWRVDAALIAGGTFVLDGLLQDRG